MTKNPEKLVCHYCGAEKEEVSFFIGATKEPDWCMVEGTGYMSCPLCYPRAIADGKARIDQHIKEHNAAVERKINE